MKIPAILAYFPEIRKPTSCEECRNGRSHPVVHLENTLKRGRTGVRPSKDAFIRARYRTPCHTLEGGSPLPPHSGTAREYPIPITNRSSLDIPWRKREKSAIRDLRPYSAPSQASCTIGSLSFSSSTRCMNVKAALTSCIF